MAKVLCVLYDDLEGMQVGTVAAGRIGLAVLRRLKAFDVGLHYTDRHRLGTAECPDRRRYDTGGPSFLGQRK
jgi:lactate dehydrogenase-like 2-hydroxyacid dehydrogenase